ncbi:MAG: c-type cytochrome [Thermosynechococcaceae cyanobacterium MS004]|nr:c-type cytochrome [Thermosynechococcaceae cyanobacterium MS004]
MGIPAQHRSLFRRLYYGVLIALCLLVATLWSQIRHYQPSRLRVQWAPEVRFTEEPIQPIPVENVANPQKIALGEQLFQEVRLSSDNQVSCLSCHKFERGGADDRAHSVGIRGQATQVNTPSIFNVKYNFRFNWDGEFENLSDHLEGLLTSPSVMNMQWEPLVQKLQQIPTYRREFAQIYPDGITASSIKDAIVVYQEALTTPNSRFDQFLRGDKQALTATEQEGYQRFKEYGCVSCHQGINVGGNLFQRFGVMGNYFADRGNITESDLGRYNVTRDPADRFVFRVPSLRNVALTAPYFHDGSAKTLEEAIAIMVKYQLGRSLPPKHIQRIAEFLRTLTGEYQGNPLG